MKTKLSIWLTGLLLAVLSAGCYSTVEGKNKAGVPWGKDRIVSRYELDPERAFAAAKEALSLVGTLQSENRIANTLEAKVDNNSVWVKVEEIEPGVTQVTTAARSKGGGTNLTMASEVDKRIALELVPR